MKIENPWLDAEIIHTFLSSLTMNLSPKILTVGLVSHRTDSNCGGISAPINYGNYYIYMILLYCHCRCVTNFIFIVKINYIVNNSNNELLLLTKHINIII